jgi:hypothetical protein
VVQLVSQGPAEARRIKGFTADHAADKLHVGYLGPFPLQEVVKLYRPLRANPPTVAATGTACHVMEKGPPFSIINILEGIGRAVLNTGKTPVTFFVYFKKGHPEFSRSH